MARHFLLYGHGGSYNHGCEALTRCTIALLRREFSNSRITLSTHFAEQDRQFKIDADEIIERNMDGRNNEEVYSSTLKSITPDSVCIHVAGDNYCYRNWQRYAQIHYKTVERGATSILWSCSIDPNAIDDEMLAALKSHHLITTRENITYRALMENGLSNVIKVSDIAFTLKPEPIEFEHENFVALNLSPIIMKNNALVQKAFQRLTDYIIYETDMKIALVPHVINPADNDLDAFRMIDAHDSTRVVPVSYKLSAGQYKSIVSKARFCVTARTHLAITSYSSCVPVLAVGYNSKSQGIAEDLEMTDYVLGAERVTNELDIVNAFRKLINDNNIIISKLKDKIPEYIGSAVNIRALKALRREEF